MKPDIFAGLLGASVAMLLAAVPLLRQREGLSRLPAVPSAVTVSKGAKAHAVLDAWKHAQASGIRSAGELEAAESVQNLTAEECRAAAHAALASGNPGPLSDLLGRWASLEGAAAFAWLDEHPDLVDLVLADAGPAWAASDPAGYAAWLATYHSDKETSPFYSMHLSSEYLAPHDLPAAIRITVEKVLAANRYQLNINAGDLRPHIQKVEDAEALGSEILAHPEWSSRLPADDPLDLLIALRYCWQEIDPESWDRWADSHPSLAAKAYSRDRESASFFLGSRNPEHEAERILAVTPPDKQQMIIEAIIPALAETDINAAGTWLDKQPESPDKWEAMQTFALAAVEQDPAAALTWARSIPDPAQQARAQRRVLAKWADTDPAAAADWLPQSGWTGPQLQAARDILATARPAAKPR